MMSLIDLIIRAVDVTTLGYFVALDMVYIALLWLAVRLVVSHRTRRGQLTPHELCNSRYAPSVTVVVPARNEELVIVGAVSKVLSVAWRNLECIVVLDGCSDRTHECLSAAYDLELVSSASAHRAWRSTTDARLLVLEQPPSGKAQALNLGVAHATGELVCVVDADSRIDPYALGACVLPFVERPREVAATSGIIRVGNSCGEMADGGMRSELSPSLLVRLQIVEYLRAFHIGRSGWSRMGALPIISGAFGVFRRDLLLAVGGFDRTSVGEDLEIVVRLHQRLRGSGLPSRIELVPEVVCWTEVPDSLHQLRPQRERWQRGLAETLWTHRRIMCDSRQGMFGWLAMPFLVLFELCAPLLELVGLAAVIVGVARGIVGTDFLLAFLLLGTVIGACISVAALLLDEMTFARYPRRQLVLLAAVALLEGFGYRQLTALWRVRSMANWLLRRRAVWGEMRHHETAISGLTNC